MRWTLLIAVLLGTCLVFWYGSRDAEWKLMEPLGAEAELVKPAVSEEVAPADLKGLSDLERIQGAGVDSAVVESESGHNSNMVPGPVSKGGAERSESVVGTQDSCTLVARITGFPSGAATKEVEWQLQMNGNSLRADTVLMGEQFKAVNLPPGSYAILAKTVAKPFLSTHEFHFDLTAEKPTRHFELEMQACQILQGRIVDEDGLPISGATVVDRNGMRDLSLPPLPSMVTNELGTFEISLVPHNHVFVEVTKAGYLPRQYKDPIAPGETAWAELVLSWARTVKGTVYWPDGSVAPNVHVHGLSGANVESALTDSTGRFRFLQLSYHELELFARGGGEGENDYSNRWKFGANEDLSSLDLWLLPSATYEGSIVDLDGLAIESLEVILESTTSGLRPVRRAKTDGSGSFEVRGLYPGEYTIHVTHLSRSLGKVTLEEGGEVRDAYFQVTRPPAPE